MDKRCAYIEPLSVEVVRTDRGRRFLYDSPQGYEILAERLFAPEAGDPITLSCEIDEVPMRAGRIIDGCYEFESRTANSIVADAFELGTVLIFTPERSEDLEPVDEFAHRLLMSMLERDPERRQPIFKIAA